MASLGPFYRPVEEAPPWDWNPGATFMRAYNDAQENKRLNEKAAMEQELNSILFPAKKAQAEFTIKQLTYESERMANSYKLMNEEVDERRRLLKAGGVKGSSIVQPNGNTGNSAGAFQSQFGFGRGIGGNQQPIQKRTLGSGLNPK